MPYPQDPHPVPGSTGKPVYTGHLFWRRLVGWECAMCGGSGRINHQCGMGACFDDPCTLCKDTGYLPLTPEKRREETGYVPKDDPRLDTIIGPPRSPEKRREEYADREFTGDELKQLVLDIEGAVGKNAAGCTPLGRAVTELAEAAWKKDQA